MKSAKDHIDIGDYMKLAACTAVMLQPILQYALNAGVSSHAQMAIGFAYDLIKFTAPAFIFGILYTTTRLTIDNNITYRQYLKQQWHALFIPTIWWTSIYLLMIPSVQQVEHYTDWKSFLWQFINGNAAPHLWYNTMMLQFIMIMPIFWVIGRFCLSNVRRVIAVSSVVILLTCAWIWFYDFNVLYGPHAKSWYLLDRFFISFLIYGVFGVLSWQNNETFYRIIPKIKWIIVIVAILAFVWTGIQMVYRGLPVSLPSAAYYQPSMIIYDLAIIGLISILGIFQITKHSSFTVFVHRFAAFAYKAFLSNVFWSYLIWELFGQKLANKFLFIGIFVVYLLTWLLSFASAFIINTVWTMIKVRIR